MKFKTNKFLLGGLALAMALFLFDRSAVGVRAYNAAVSTVFPGDVQVDDLKLAGNDILDSGGTTRITTGATTTLTATTVAITGNATVSGTLAVTGATTQTGAQTFAAPVTFSSTTYAVVPATETITAAATITADACGGIKRISSAGSVTTNTTNTFTAPSSSNAGCIMLLVNVGSNNIVLDNNALFVSAAAGDITVTANDALIVATDGNKWYQISALLAN
jgi:hypothetical protein